MDGLTHIVIAVCGIAGFFIGSVMIDLDHSNLSWKNIKAGFNNIHECDTQKGVLHEPIVAFSVALFSIGVGVGIILHLLLDGLYG